MYQNIRNVWCAVLNYKDTAKEVNAHPPLEPIFFLKAGSTITDEKQPIILPTFSQEVLYEIEIALQFNEKLQVDRVGLGLDLTAGDSQKKLNAQSFPWTLAKSFKNSCPIGSFLPIKNLDSLNNLDFSLSINGIVCQNANTQDMVFSCKQLVSYLLSHFPVCPHDIILTGTPAGVSQIRKGDRLVGKIADYYTANWVVAE